jgi:nucleotidyltransferase substrate binding protein (TIGR01987 family)
MAELFIRWHKRLNSFEKAFAQLENAVALKQTRNLSDLEKQGLIQAFEFTHELAWNLMKDYLVWQGFSNITGSRDATREAFANGLIADGETWMAMIQSRNLTSHTYNQHTADQIVDAISSAYTPIFCSFLIKMQDLQKKC